MEPTEYVTTKRMTLASNILQDARHVQVIDFDPPVDGGPHGLLHVRCPTEDDYWAIRRFVDEERGSALKAADGGVWYIHRLDDDAQVDQPFPQHIHVRVEWRYR